MNWQRRDVLRALAGGGAAAVLGGCGDAPEPGRYTQADIELLAQQRREEAAARGSGPYGEQRYRGYRGLAKLPWFGLDDAGRLVLIDESVPASIDVHAHLGMSVLFRPELDLLAHTDRTRHFLDCDGSKPGCDLDLDIYINGNFDEDGLRQLRSDTRAQGLWGSETTRSHTLPNLLAEMDAMRVERSLVLPIKLGLPFGDTLTQQWRRAIAEAGAGDRVLCGLSVNPHDDDCVDELRELAVGGARIVKLHPTVQRFYPDDRKLWPLYEEAASLGLVVFFHGGRAGIEPEDRLRYAMPRHYAAVLRDFPQLPVVLGHAGARDGAAMLDLALRHDNAWLGIHGQGVSRLDAIVRATGGRRLLFGTDWPWYHLGATLAKVLLVTEGETRTGIRRAILRDNALALFPELDHAA